MHHDGKIDHNTFKELYESEYYELKRGRALEFLARAAPQTHTHGEQNTNTRKKDIKNQEKQHKRRRSSALWESDRLKRNAPETGRSRVQIPAAAPFIFNF